jgi:hypothetical protein
MESSGYPSLPLLLRHAQPAPVSTANYSYDHALEVNITIDEDGNIRPVVEGMDVAVLTKTVADVGEE